MQQSTEQIVRETQAAMAQVRREMNTPAKARAFLIEAGILERHKGSKDGVRLAKPYRPTR